MARFVHQRSGFTLVEIMVVVGVVGLLSSLALPAMTSARDRARTSALVNDLRTFETAFLLYRMENFAWPADRNRGILPPEIVGYIGEGVFTRETPIGGNYDWDPSSSGSLPDGIGAAISVRSHVLTDDEVQALVTRFDDGSRETGQIRASGSDLHYIIE